ncbi:transglutaminase domain-containing protein [Plantactinospora sp. KLBMP9567]|uniref:transglutaminase domain-containing protein n=1 Tax=Plantactinospora sp. KLBMP9567 TaxID=3085900 RepID=UPI00298230A2|nr:transglutaminase domain-containing protein [Plantactinospora sp. KLBMP9567]MDW5324831.1 transglutaminase domain-containing protein [Plantactinospora sp. KLBMP9567]
MTIPTLAHSSKRIQEVVERLRRVPDTARMFSESAAEARRLHRVDQSLQARLLDLGMPHRGPAADPHFDSLDLANVGLGLGLRCPRWLAMRWWSKSLTQVVPGQRLDYRMELSASCPSPGHAGACRFEVHPRLRAAMRAGTCRETGPGRYAFEVRLDSGRHLFGGSFTELIDQIRPVQFHLLPYPLNTDLGFLRDSGLADCRLAANYLHRLGGSLGLPVRSTAGYFVAPPYATVHVWLEFQVDGDWLPADPFLLNALNRWGIVDPGQWPPHRSPQGLLWSVHDEFIELLRHNGQDVLLYPAMVVTDQHASPL